MHRAFEVIGWMPSASSCGDRSASLRARECACVAKKFYGIEQASEPSEVIDARV